MGGREKILELGAGKAIEYSELLWELGSNAKRSVDNGDLACEVAERSKHSSGVVLCDDFN